jgi:1-acyl-sn-glycerol-3-phosphate acyltransferase
LTAPPQTSADHGGLDASGSQVERLSAILETLARELHPERAGALRVQHDSSLERDLGIDSLARVELLLRLEKGFGLRLSEDALMTAETAADLLAALREASPAVTEEPEWRPAQTPSATSAPEEALTLLDVLAFHRQAHGERAHIHLIGAKPGVWTMTYGALWQGAQEIAAGLANEDLPRSSAVAIMLPTDEDFFQVFLGVLLAGCVPLPIYPPMRRTQIAEHLRRQAGILRNAETPLLITTPEATLFGRLIQAQVACVREVRSPGGLRRAVEAEIIPQLGGEDLALLQYTSGSTGDPKGVMLSHANLLANIRALGQALDVTSRDVVVSWLPLYHDMGLIGAWLGSLYFASPFVVMPPLTFLARPERWLKAIDRFRGTISPAPNFAYEFAVSKVRDEAIEGLDLSSWRVASNGAERVARQTVERFIERYGPHGFRAEAMTPMYGLAESAVALTTSPLGRGPHFDRVQRRDLANWGRAVPSSKAGAEQIDVVSCGVPLPGHEVRVVDTAGRELGDRQEGAIQFRGPSATQGYLRAPDKTRALIHDDGWLETGDRGYLAEGELYITGRIKDIIIRAGHNLYPDEVEDAVGDLEGIRKGQVAVFAVEDTASGSERLVILAECRQRDPAKRERLRHEVTILANDLIGTPPDEVVLAPPGTVVKTPNGKVRRSACRQLYESGRLGRPPPALWLQIVGLLQSSIAPQFRRWWQALAALLFAVRFQLCYRALAPIVFFGVILLPGLSRRRHLFRGAARLMLRLAGIAQDVEGLERLPEERPLVIAANHASYLDGLALAAALPIDTAFIAKRELVKGRIAGPFLRGLGTVFVERFDPAGGVESVNEAVRALETGESLTVFPEGTFDRRAGLRAFHIGAFVAACQAGVPVVPVGLSGTRGILRGESAFARRGRIRVSVGEAIQPTGGDWQAALALRDEARRAILALCREPDLIGEPTAI